MSTDANNDKRLEQIINKRKMHFEKQEELVRKIRDLGALPKNFEVRQLRHGLGPFLTHFSGCTTPRARVTCSCFVPMFILDADCGFCIPTL